MMLLKTSMKVLLASLLLILDESSSLDVSSRRSRRTNSVTFFSSSSSSSSSSILRRPYQPLSSVVTRVTASSSSSSSTCSRMYATTTTAEQDQQVNDVHQVDDEDEEVLTDLDTRILQSMLHDQKETLSLDTEDGIRQLLQRGTTGKPKAASAAASKADQQADNSSDSKYSSTVLQTFADTRLWRKLSAQADDLLESAKLWVSNKVENDLKVVAALGLFAWDRVQRDVARALPATSSAQQRRRNGPLLLSNSSSYAVSSSTFSSSSSALDDLTRPSDEIRSVTRTILDILSGQATTRSTDARSLRTVAPSGTTRVADRQKRAYRQQQRTSKQRQNVMNVAVQLPRQAVDAAWELRQELNAESSRPGYKSAPLRNALQESVTQTTQYLQAVKQQRQLQVSRQALSRLQQAQTSVSLTQADLYEQVVQERVDLLQRLKQCIEAPELTWLSDEAVATAAATDKDQLKLDNAGLQLVVTMMIEIRDEMQEEELLSLNDNDDVNNNMAFSSRIDDLVGLRQQIATLQDQTATAVSPTIAKTLFNEIVGEIDAGDNDDDDVDDFPQALLLRLEELQANYDKLERRRSEMEQQTVGLETSLMDLEASMNNNNMQAVPAFAAALRHDSDSEFARVNADIDDERSSPIVAEPSRGEPMYVDVVPEHEYATSSSSSPFFASTVVDVAEDSVELDSSWSSPGFMAEVVTDDDFDAAFGQARATRAVDVDGNVDDNGDIINEPNVLIDLSLRALDVVFYVVEKTITVVLPNTLRIGQTVTERIQELQRTKNGSPGWERMRNTVDAKGRY